MRGRHDATVQRDRPDLERSEQVGEHVAQVGTACRGGVTGCGAARREGTARGSDEGQSVPAGAVPVHARTDSRTAGIPLRCQAPVRRVIDQCGHIPQMEQFDQTLALRARVPQLDISLSGHSEPARRSRNAASSTIRSCASSRAPSMKLDLRRRRNGMPTGRSPASRRRRLRGGPGPGGRARRGPATRVRPVAGRPDHRLDLAVREVQTQHSRIGPTAGSSEAAAVAAVQPDRRRTSITPSRRSSLRSASPGWEAHPRTAPARRDAPPDGRRVSRRCRRAR